MNPLIVQIQSRTELLRWRTPIDGRPDRIAGLRQANRHVPEALGRKGR